jgi:hypothetical protein
MALAGAAEADFVWLLGVLRGGPVMRAVGSTERAGPITRVFRPGARRWPEIKFEVQH